MAKKIVCTCDANNCDCTENVTEITLQNGWNQHYYEGNYYDDSYTETTPSKARIDLCPEHLKEFNEFFNKKLFTMVGEKNYFNLVNNTIKEYTGLDVEQKERKKVLIMKVIYFLLTLIALLLISVILVIPLSIYFAYEAVFKDRDEVVKICKKCNTVTCDCHEDSYVIDYKNV